MSGISFTCIGACGGDPKWRSPDSGLCCSLCGGSGKVTVYNQQESAAEDFDKFMASRKASAERRQQKRVA